MSVDVDRFWAKVRLGEDTDLELKEVRFRGKSVTAPKRHDLADGLAAFANAAGGWLVLGVSDDRTPQPLDAAQLDAVVHLVTEICSDSIEPALDPGLHRMPLSETAGPCRGRKANKILVNIANRRHADRISFGADMPGRSRARISRPIVCAPCGGRQ